MFCGIVTASAERDLTPPGDLAKTISRFSPEGPRADDILPLLAEQHEVLFVSPWSLSVTRSNLLAVASDMMYAIMTGAEPKVAPRYLSLGRDGRKVVEHRHSFSPHLQEVHASSSAPSFLPGPGHSAIPRTQRFF